MTKPDKPQINFDDLNFLGKAVFLSGSVVSVVAEAIDTVVTSAVDVWVAAEKAFLDELDPNVEDAKVLEEHEEDQ